MEQKRLNDELTVIGLTLIVLFITYYLASSHTLISKLQDELLNTKKIAIMLDKRLSLTETKLDLTKDSLEDLKSDLQEYEQLDSILKDIATSWDRGTN